MKFISLNNIDHVHVTAMHRGCYVVTGLMPIAAKDYTGRPNLEVAFHGFN